MVNHQPIEAKVVILGAQGVGKTSIVLRYVGKVFSNRVNPTIGASFFTFTMDVDSTKIKIQLWDTAGQERFRAMAPMYYRKANAAIIVYDITSPKSFEQAKDWIEELHRNIGSDIALCIVGNKVDLSKEMRKVSTEKGREFAKSLGATFSETSAALDTGIKEMFSDTARKVVDLHKKEQQLGSQQHHLHSPFVSSHYSTSGVYQSSSQWTPSQGHQQQSSENIILPDAIPQAEAGTKPPNSGWCCWK